MLEVPAVWLGKIIQKSARFLKIGGGSAAPGLWALRIEPRIIQRLSHRIPHTVLVTGTNGKTTTARLLAHFATSAGLRVLHNSTGSNMERGITSKLIEASNIFGHLSADLAIWEVDEANLKNLLPKIKPEVVVILNAARDQLDRYGELDSLVREWRQALSKIDFPTRLILNGDDLNTNSLALKSQKIASETFGTKEKVVEWEENNPTGTRDYLATNLGERGFESINFTFSAPGKKGMKASLPVPGLYNVYNFLASFAAGSALGLTQEGMIEAAKSYRGAFGRMEHIKVKKSDCFICLIKNPSGASVVFSTLKNHIRARDGVLLALNDRLADGRDISWIWDAKFETLVDFRSQSFICSGERAEDLALRLKYAGVSSALVETNLRAALREGLKEDRLFIMPTYTALLSLQKILAEMGVKVLYWEEE